jgi:hypothetical protein
VPISGVDPDLTGMGGIGVPDQVCKGLGSLSLLEDGVFATDTSSRLAAIDANPLRVLATDTSSRLAAIGANSLGVFATDTSARLAATGANSLISCSLMRFCLRDMEYHLFLISLSERFLKSFAIAHHLAKGKQDGVVRILYRPKQLTSRSDSAYLLGTESTVHVLDELFFVTRPFPLLDSGSEVVLPAVTALFPVSSTVQLFRNDRPLAMRGEVVFHTMFAKDFHEIVVILCQR